VALFRMPYLRNEARLVRSLVVFSWLATFSPGVTLAQESVGSNSSGVVYGVDDRLDWYASPDANFRSIARDSIVAIVETVAIDPGDANSNFPPFSSGVPSLSEYSFQSSGFPLCAGERFATQPTAASCSGTLIAPNLVVSAGHCFPDQAACDAVSLVFDYFYALDGVPEAIGSDDIYRCSRIVARKYQTSPHLDFSVIELDRDVVDRVPARIRTEESPLPLGTGLVVLGFGTGLPLKIDAGGQVTNPGTSALDTFDANTDTFAGNSGSGIFDDSGQLVGILVTGDVDYVDDGSCVSVNEVPNSPGHETAVYAFQATDELCRNEPDLELCAGTPIGRNQGRCSNCTAGAATPTLPGVAFVLAAAAVLASRRRRAR